MTNSSPSSSSNFGGYIREAFHAGQWYTDSGAQLSCDVGSALAEAVKLRRDTIKAGGSCKGVDTPRLKSLLSPSAPSPKKIVGIYGPHAGLSYSSTTNSHAYSILEELHDQLSAMNGSCVTTGVKRVFLLGPSHHKALPGMIEVSGATHYRLPWALRGDNSKSNALAEIPCDIGVLKDVSNKANGQGLKCGVTTKHTDEEEHSLELHLPFVTRLIEAVFGGFTGASECVKAARDDRNGNKRPGPLLTSSVTVVPILVGTLSDSQHAALASVLSPYFQNPDENFFVFSTDFCHWGSRFRYTYRYNQAQFPVIGDGIQAMDMEGVNHITKKDLPSWLKYLDETENTICGRHPMTTLLHLVGSVGGGTNSYDIISTHYSQSGFVEDARDSSVSYASGVVTV